MLVEPDFDYPLEDGKSCVCLVEGQFRVCLDRNAAVELLYSLHWFAKEKPIGEEVDIWSRNCEELPCKGKRIGLCELNLVTEHKHKKQGKRILKTAQNLRQKPHGVYTEEYDRLDYYISPEEARTAYETLYGLLAEREDRRHVREVRLFGTLIVRLIG